MYTLIIEDRNGNIADEISFDQGSYTIGRVEGNDIILPSNAVSRTHARIFVSQGRCFINDLGSANGVIVDGEHISARHELRNASQIRIGDYTLYLEYAARAAGGNNDVLRTHIVANDQNTFKLVRVGDMFAGEEFSLTEQINSVGRTDDNFILLSDPSISRNHAQVVNEGMAYAIVDNGSSNGTRVNGKGVKGKQALRSGDQIEFGNVRFVFAPGNQRVDLQAYAQRKRTRGSGLTIAILVFVILVVLGILGFVGYKLMSDDDEKAETKKVEEPVETAPTLDLQATFDTAVQMANDQNWSEARRMLAQVSAVDPEFPGARDLQTRVIDESTSQANLDEGDKFFQDQDYSSAKEKFEQIPQNSVYYARAQKKLEQIRQNMASDAFMAGRKACDEAPAKACIEELCSAVELDPDSDRAAEYLKSLKKDKALKKEKELQAQIDACLKK